MCLSFQVCLLSRDNVSMWLEAYEKWTRKHGGEGAAEFAGRNCNQLDEIFASGSRKFGKFSLTLENKILVLENISTGDSTLALCTNISWFAYILLKTYWIFWCSFLSHKSRRYRTVTLMTSAKNWRVTMFRVEVYLMGTVFTSVFLDCLTQHMEAISFSIILLSTNIYQSTRVTSHTTLWTW